MQCLNRVELRGYVGSSKVSVISGTKCVRFTLATNYAYKAKDGTAVIETQWSSLVGFESAQIKDVESIRKGDKLHVIGRMVSQRYTDADGVEHSYTEVRVQRLERIEQEEPLQCEY